MSLVCQKEPLSDLSQKRLNEKARLGLTIDEFLWDITQKNWCVVVIENDEEDFPIK